MGSLHTFFLSENIYHIVDPEYSQNTKNRFAQAGGAVFFVDRRDSRFMPRRGKSPAGHHVVTDCTGSRRLFYLKSHLESVPSLLLSKMQTFHWFAFWLFLQRPKPVGHPAFLFILRKAGCPFLISRKIYADRCTRFLRRSRALPHFLGLLPLCRNECLTATANTPDSTDLEKNVWYVNR